MVKEIKGNVSNQSAFYQHTKERMKRLVRHAGIEPGTSRLPVECSDHCTNVENDRFSSGGSRPLGLDALMLMKVLNLFIVLKLHRNLRFLINFEYYLIKNELENAQNWLLHQYFFFILCLLKMLSSTGIKINHIQNAQNGKIKGQNKNSRS